MIFPDRQCPGVLTRWLATIIITMFLMTAVMLSGCTRTLHEGDFFFPRKSGIVPDGVVRRNVEIVTPDSTVLRGWLLQPATPRGTLIYFYGNAETVRTSQLRLFWLAQRYRLTVLSVDYRGYGFSDGSPSIQHLLDDALIIYDYLELDSTARSKPLMVYGRSLGSFVALHLAEQRPIAGVILEGTVTNLKDALPGIKRLLPWYVRWLVRLRIGEDLQKYEPPVETIRKISAPLLMIHGETDKLFPVARARKMYDSSPAQEKFWCEVPGAGHNNLSITHPPVVGCLDEFLALCIRKAVLQ